jgi:predicted RecB family nuclease
MKIIVKEFAVEMELKNKDRSPAMRERILVYNEDDCRATRVLLDGIRNL